MGNRRLFKDWLEELRDITKNVLEMDLESLPEFDITDARAYFNERSSPSVYFKECLSDHFDDDTKNIEEILQGA